jgi:group I intron endonuclease
MASGIYLIENIINNKKYVGSAINIQKRWYQHKSTLKGNYHDNSYLQKAWNKYGANNFKFIIIEEVQPKNLLEKEQYYIDYYDTCNKNKGYNLSPTAGNTLGFEFSDESKLKMSLLKKNKPSTRKNYKHSEETKKKIGEKNKISQLGRTHTEETKKKMRKPHGPMSDITKKKLSDWRNGLVPSEKTGQWIIKKDKKFKKINNTIKNRGENNGMAITTKKEIIAIRNDYNNGISISNLQTKYNKNYMFIYKIVKRLRWNWLDDSSLSN